MNLSILPPVSKQFCMHLLYLLAEIHKCDIVEKHTALQLMFSSRPSASDCCTSVIIKGYGVLNVFLLAAYTPPKRYAA